MRKLTAANLVSAIRNLPKNQVFQYVNPRTKGVVRVIGVAGPEGPITFKRWTPSKGQTDKNAKVESISSQMLWRMANAFVENLPLNVDRVFGASYNNRSVLECLVAHTPEFYFCYPGRVEDTAGSVGIKSGHKHIMWIPSQPHRNGVLVQKATNIAISEIPAQSVSYDLVLPRTLENASIDVNAARRHTQIQIALYLIGTHLGFRTWIAQNDNGIIFNNKPLIEQTGIVRTLQDEPMVYPHEGAVQAGLFIDCIWFNIFKPLNVLFFPYTAVEELDYLCEKRNLNSQSVNEEFLDCFMEKVANIA